MPVGQHVANSPALTNAYRVLGANGMVRPNFHWSDPLDEREVADVLAADGIVFDENGAASTAQRITASELAEMTEQGDLDE